MDKQLVEQLLEQLKEHIIKETIQTEDINIINTILDILENQEELQEQNNQMTIVIDHIENFNLNSKQAPLNSNKGA